jgi:hypothetical protein
MIQPDDSDRLCRVAGVAALAIPLSYVVSGAITGIGYRISPVPSEIIGWFALFQGNPLLGLVYLGIQDVAIAILSVPLFLALYQLQKTVSRTWALLATIFALIGIAIYLSMHTSFSMLALSSQYARATTEARRATILAGGQALIADPRAEFGMAIMWASALVFSVLMLRGQMFGRLTSVAGILGFLLFLLGVAIPAGYTSTDPLTPAETVITTLSIGGGGLLSLIWYVLVGLKLLKLKGTQLS